MFSGFFGSTTIQEDVKQSIIRAAVQSKTNTVIELLERHRININNSSLVDDYGQNLLHIAVKGVNYDLVRYLMGKGGDRLKRSVYNETPIDIAMKNYDVKMVEILLEVDYESSFKVGNKQLSDKVVELESCNRKLIESNTELSQKNGVLHLQLDDERRVGKRLRDESVVMIEENKRLKSDNKVLSDTVKVLREAAKKN